MVQETKSLFQNGVRAQIALVNGSIFFVFVLPTAELENVTPFQGFNFGLFELLPLLHLPLRLPPDVFDLCLKPEDRLVRRRTGFAPWIWLPINVDALTNGDVHPTSSSPFMVVFTAEPEVTKLVAEWKRSLLIQPLHVNIDGAQNAVPFSELTLPRLNEYCHTALRQAGQIGRESSLAQLSSALQTWREEPSYPCTLHWHSHNVTIPNELVLRSLGRELILAEQGELRCSQEVDYIEGIRESAQTVADAQEIAIESPLYFLTPAYPDIILFAPASYRGLERELIREKWPAQLIKTFKAHERQEGYISQLSLHDEDLKREAQELVNWMGLRAVELKIQAIAVGLRAASTFAATLRLKQKVNRTAGVVGSFARHIRCYDDRPPDRKTARVFRAVQKGLTDTVPTKHMELIAKSRSGVKIISDAPLEWLPIEGLPLSLWTDVSRINVTPGNLLIKQLTLGIPLSISAKAFKDFLVLSMFDTSEKEAEYVRIGLESLGELGVQGNRCAPSSVDEFIECLNSYHGPIIIIDSHGNHPSDSDIGGLVIGGQQVNIWELREKIRVPPIVVLSACDTHPFDRSHVTSANGFLNCGAIAVLATVLPVRFPDAARFIHRLILRTIRLKNAIDEIGLCISWSKIVTGVLREHLAEDLILGFEDRRLITETLSKELHIQVLRDVNYLRHDWFLRLRSIFLEARTISANQWQTAFDDILAGSDVIRYVQLGNPESIIVCHENVVEKLAQQKSATDFLTA